MDKLIPKINKQFALLYFTFSFFVFVVIAQQLYNISIQIKSATSIPAASSILSNTTDYPYINTVRDLFTDIDNNTSPPVPAVLGVGYVVTPVTNYSFYLNSPCVWVQVHAKDLNNYIPPSDLYINRKVMASAYKAWFDDGTVSNIEGHTGAWISYDGINDDGASYMYDIENDEAVALDPPRISAQLFTTLFPNGKYVTRSKRRTNYCIHIYQKSTGNYLKTIGYKLQLEAIMNPNPSGWIEHVSSFIQSDAVWSLQELEYTNWQ